MLVGTPLVHLQMEGNRMPKNPQELGFWHFTQQQNNIEQNNIVLFTLRYPTILTVLAKDMEIHGIP